MGTKSGMFGQDKNLKKKGKNNCSNQLPNMNTFHKTKKKGWIMPSFYTIKSFSCFLVCK